MRKAWILAGFLGIAALPAMAQPIRPDQPLGAPPAPGESDILRRSTRALPPPAPDSGAPGMASGLAGLVQPDGRIVITRDLCAGLAVQHVPAPDVTHRPGAEAVAPADLPGSGAGVAGLGRGSSTDLLITPQGRVPVQRGGVVGETYVGRVTVDGAGRVVMNGQPLGQDGQAELRQLCQRAGY